MHGEGTGRRTMDRDEIERARAFAARAHKGQRRKGTDLPYIEHPLRVARLLEEAGASCATIIAGLLHDTTEDTPVRLADIRAEFGDSVASIVAEASEPDKSLPWEERKKGTIEKLRSSSWESSLVFTADKIDNLRSTAADLGEIGEEVWKRFKRGRDKQEWYYRECLKSLRENPTGIASHPLVGELEAEIEKVFPSS
jgi:(p)ppGpp synthase/HD superfamily hydrolase